MNSIVYIVTICIVAVIASPSDDGKWHPDKHGDSGRYNRPPNEGKYIHVPNPYLHMNNPYNGGYGPYEHQGQDIDPYVGEASEPQGYRYVVTPPKEYYKPGNYSNNGTKILDQHHNYKSDGYDFQFKTENKISANEKAVMKKDESGSENIESQGFYEYIGPDGFLYRVDYTAGVGGFRPKVRRIETPFSGKWVKETSK